MILRHGRFPALFVRSLVLVGLCVSLAARTSSKSAFIVNLMGWLLADSFGWIRVLAVQTPITAAFLVASIRSRSYHGILCRRINSDHFDDWLAGNL